MEPAAPAVEPSAPAAPKPTAPKPKERTPLMKGLKGLSLRDVVEESLKRKRSLAWRWWLLVFSLWLTFTTAIYHNYALAPFCPGEPVPGHNITSIIDRTPGYNVTQEEEQQQKAEATGQPADMPSSEVLSLREANGALQLEVSRLRQQLLRRQAQQSRLSEGGADSGLVCKNPTWAMAAFFSVQMGFHVGYGILDERTTMWRWFTILHGFVSLAFITAALSLFVARAGSQFNKHAHKALKEGSLGLLDEKAREVCVEIVLPWLAVVVCLLSGTFFQVWYNNWHWVDAYYWSFYSMSTGGQMGPGSVDDIELMFCVVFILIAVPLFGNAIGLLASQIAKSGFLAT